MTAIDVNSARSTKGKDIEDTAYKTNLEAAKEVARQLRLRDVGGLVVIDFIDMMDSKHQEKVESAFRKAVFTDRARVQISNISRFGLLEVSRQRLRPSLNESYDIEHVLVRGPRSLGQSILRIIGEDSAKDNTAEIQVFVPSDVASYLLNEKRNDIIRIERANNIRVIIVADPYKSRPYYKVSRIKASDVKKIDSYKLTPNSPEPDTDWRDEKNQSNSMKPLVDGIKPPKMPKKKKEGLVSWIKSIAGLETEEKKKPTKTKKNTRRKPQQKRKAPNKNIANNAKKKQVHKKPNSKNVSDKSKTANKKTKDVNQNKSQQPKKHNVSEKPKSDSKNVKVKNESKNVKKVTKKTKETKKIEPKANQPIEKKPLIQEIKVESKPKKEIPTRASNDPRDKN
jgi:ribonuclease E